MIPLSKPAIGKEEMQLVQKVFSSNWLGQGEFVEQFENRIKNYLNVQNVIAVNNCTSGLHLSLDSIGVGDGDEVIVPSQTFAASIQAIIATGASPVFCEISPSDFNVDISDIENKITSKTSAIMPVHMYGIPCNMDAILEIANKHNLIVIEDAAHAFGSEYNGKMIGSFGHITCFSFDPIKNITCGEGGAICLQDNDLASLLIKKKNLGIDRDGWVRNTENSDLAYQVTTKGFRYHMSNINAAIGLAQFEKIEAFKNRKQEIIRQYNEAFKSLPEIRILNWNLSDTFPFSYGLRILNGRRDRLMKYLNTKGVQTRINYIPNHLQPAFRTNISLPVTEQVYNEMISLPLFFDLSKKDLNYIIDSVLTFFDKSQV